MLSEDGSVRADYAVASREAALELVGVDSAGGVGDVEREIRCVSLYRPDGLVTVEVADKQMVGSDRRVWRRVSRAALVATAVLLLAGGVTLASGVMADNVMRADVGVGLILAAAVSLIVSMLSSPGNGPVNARRLEFEPGHRLHDAAVAAGKLRALDVPGIEAASRAWEDSLLTAVRLLGVLDREREAARMARKLGDREFETAADRVVASLDATVAEFEERAAVQLELVEGIERQVRLDETRAEFDRVAVLPVAGALLDDSGAVGVLSQASVDTVEAISRSLRATPGTAAG